MNVFEPSDRKTNGAIVFAHGGGYVAGSVKLFSNFLSWLANATGTKVFAPHYRLAPRRMWPGQFDEAMETIAYVEIVIDRTFMFYIVMFTITQTN